MTPDKMADIAALIPLLRAKWPAENKARFGDINPNGPQAATALTELLAEREGLIARAALLHEVLAEVFADNDATGRLSWMDKASGVLALKEPPHGRRNRIAGCGTAARGLRYGSNPRLFPGTE